MGRGNVDIVEAETGVFAFSLYSVRKLCGFTIAFYFHFEDSRFFEIACSLKLVDKAALSDV